ncbi:Integrator complex subunit 10, variant 2 [Basidiobolus ranarum]|uniref:Integrator complex subunit 10 n=1 Tax=Basidiobolus ranarum TaxID=34480 RepID=A0ABR2WU42_9FUNG
MKLYLKFKYASFFTNCELCFNLLLLVKLLLFEIVLAGRDFTRALKVLRDLRVKHGSKEEYRSLICRIAHSTLHGSKEELAELFHLLPRDTRKELLIEVGGIYIRRNHLFDACRIYAFVCYFFPELIPHYGPLAAELVIKTEKESRLPLQVNIYRQFLLRGILPQIFSVKVKVGQEIKRYSTYKATQVEISYDRLLEWMKLHQAYYLSRIQWNTMHNSFVHIAKQCDYLPENCEITSATPVEGSNSFFPDKLLESLCLQKYVWPIPLKSLFLSSCLVQICFEYQSLIFNPSKLNGTSEPSDIHQCSILLIPHLVECFIPVGGSKLTETKHSHSEKKSSKRVKTSKSSQIESTAKAMPVNGKGLFEASSSRSTPDGNRIESTQAIIALRKAQELLGLIEGIDHGCILDQIVNDWSLPFHIVNAILLCKADVRMMQKQYSDAHATYLLLSSRCQTRWQDKANTKSVTSAPFHPLYHFRLLYLLSLTSEQMESLKAARKYIFPILSSGLPCCIEDLRTQVEKSSKFRLKPVTSFELLSYSIQRLVALYEHEIKQTGFNHDLIGDLLVLLQYTEVKLLDKLRWISSMLIQNGSFVYREFFNFTFSEVILQQIFQVKNINALQISLLPVKVVSDHSSSIISEVSQVDQNRMLEAQLQLAVEKTPKKILLLREFCKRSYLRDQGLSSHMWQRNIHSLGEFWN